MNVIIIGGGKVGTYLASLLLQDGHTVKVIESREEQIPTLQHDLPQGIIVEGNGTDLPVLEAAGIQNADSVISVTGNDETNLIASTLARYEYSVKRVIARVNNPKNAWLFTPEMGVDVGLNQADLMAHLVAEEMSVGDMLTLLKLHMGRYSLVKEPVHPTSIVVGKALQDLQLPTDCIMVAVIRGSELVLPRGITVLHAGDEVMAITDTTKVCTLADMLGPRI